MVRREWTALVVSYAGVAVAALTELVGASPVSERQVPESGEFRGAWQVGVGAAPPAGSTTPDPAGGQTIAQGRAQIDRMQGIQPIHIVNRTPYGEDLERGRSRQAPAGVLGVTVERIRARFARVVVT